MSHGRPHQEQRQESESPAPGLLGGIARRIKRHVSEWPDRCVEMQIDALEGQR